MSRFSWVIVIATGVLFGSLAFAMIEGVFGLWFAEEVLTAANEQFDRQLDTYRFDLPLPRIPVVDVPEPKPMPQWIPRITPVVKPKPHIEWARDERADRSATSEARSRIGPPERP